MDGYLALAPKGRRAVLSELRDACRSLLTSNLRTGKSSKEVLEAVSDRAEVFVAGVSGRPRGAPRTTGEI